MKTDPSATPEVTVGRLAMYIASEVWPRFVKQFGLNDLAAFTQLQHLALWFACPKDANDSTRTWLLDFMTESPDVVVWSLNELRVESDKLVKFEIKKGEKGKNNVGALKFLVLLGIEKWDYDRGYITASGVEAAAAVILGETNLSLDRKFENASRTVRQREEEHHRTYARLIAASLPYPRYRSVGLTYPQIAEKFPEVVPLLDKAAAERIVLPAINSGIALYEVVERIEKALAVRRGVDNSESQGD